ncbi:MAG TPA: NUDIX hydrolase, partial [Alcanivorax sp.]|nr:NUDIX hydrolase [Alcanivorax sp.]
KFFIQDRANGNEFPVRTQDIPPLKRKPSLDD